MKYLITVLPLLLLSTSLTFAAALQDGCYAMTQTTTGGFDDVGVICVEGLYSEGVGHNLKVVTLGTNGQKHFCGLSNDFSFSPPADPKVITIRLKLGQQVGTIIFSGDSEKGEVKIVSQNIQYYSLKTVMAEDSASDFTKNAFNHCP